MTVKTVHVPMVEHVKTLLITSSVPVPKDTLVPLATKVCYVLSAVFTAIMLQKRSNVVMYSVTDNKITAS